MKEIPLTQGMVALVDDEDFERLARFKWRAQRCSRRPSSFYATRWDKQPGGGRLVVKMHRDILAADAGAEVDHRDGNGLNNTRANLRLATHSQNQHNARLRKDNKSGYKGVSWRESRQRFQAAIALGGKQVFLGHFRTAEEAHAAYCKAAEKYHGAFRRTA